MSGLTAGTEALWRERRTTTAALVTLVVLVAFESFAVTTVMPGVADLLDGHALYAFAFAGPLATGVVGMVVAGTWSDRTGPFRPFLAGSVLFVVGLVVAGAAHAMPVLVAGRLAQGLGGGAVNVTLLVTLARAYPAALHPRAFAWFSAAWVLPSLVGPTVAGLVAEVAGWRWVFLGVALLVVPTSLPLLRTLRPLGPPDADAPAPADGRRRVLRAVLVAAAVLALNLAVELPPAASAALATAAGVAALVVVGPLLPAGARRARPGLPSVIATRALVSGAFFGAQAYVPYLLAQRDGWSPTASGLALTTAALAWSGMSAVQGRLGHRLRSRDAVRLGTALVAVGAVGSFVTAAAALPPAVLVATWTFAGAGMGLASSRLNVLVLGYSATGRQGTNSSALSIADAVGSAVALAVSGVVVALVTGAQGAAASEAVGSAGFAAAFGLAGALALGAALTAPRVGTPPTEADPDAAAATAPAGQPSAGSAQATAAST